MAYTFRTCVHFGRFLPKFFPHQPPPPTLFNTSSTPSLMFHSLSFSSGNFCSQNTKVGIVGLGNVGSAVLNNLLREGHPVVGCYDVQSSKSSLLPQGIKMCSSPREVTELADIVVTGLPRPPNVKAAAEGPEGILEGLSAGKVWVDHSTTDYKQTREYAKIASSRGAHVLEAPITGGLESLKKGQMVVYVGGNKEVCKEVTPILKASYSEVFYVGDIGSAMVVKVASNMLCCVHVVAMAEVLVLAKRSGIDLKTFWDAIRLSAGNSFVWETGAPVVFQGTYDPGFTMDLQVKDLQLGYDMAREFKVPMDIHQFTLAVYRRVMYEYGGDVGCYAPPKAYERGLSETLQIPKFKNWSYDNKFINGSVLVAHNDVEK